MRNPIRVAAAAVLVCAVTGATAACGTSGNANRGAVAATTWNASAAKTATAGATPSPTRTGPAPMVGLYINGVPSSTAPLSEFNSETGVSPKFALYFSEWGQSFETKFATTEAGRGAIPVVQIESGGLNVESIADGAQDAYLDKFAEQVRDFGHQVVLSYGHEMNGDWYHWGWKRTSPATFVAAWRHIVTLFRAEGATNVTWMWTVQAAADAPTLTTDPGPWWPGSSYVDWVGIDGHYIYQGQTFSKIFDPAIAEVRAITSKPILISETSISKDLNQVQDIPDLFQGVESRGLLGFVYFDKDGNHDYRLDTSATLAAFGAAAKKYGYAK